MNWVDLTIFAVLTLFGLRGFFRGFFREVFSITGLILGFMAAAGYEPRLSAWAAQHWQGSLLLIKAAAFVAIFFTVYFSINLIGWFLHRWEKLLFMKAFNRAAGVAVGAGKGIAVAALGVFFLGSSSLLPARARETLAASHLAAPLSQLAEDMIRVGKEKVSAAANSPHRAPPYGFRI